MRRTAILAAALCILITPAIAVVGHNGSDGDMSITSSGSTASGTTAVGPNGTEYSAKVSMDGRVQQNTSDRIRSETISSRQVSFKGTIEAPTPCYVIDHEVEEKEEGYVLNIKTVEEGGDGPCTQVVTGINYDAEFEAEPGYELEVQHNGQQIETYQTTSDSGDSNDKEKKSFWQQILEFLGL